MDPGESVALNQSKVFVAESPAKARTAASTWLMDFTQHGPLNIKRISVTRSEETFLAIVTYSENFYSVETTVSWKRFH